MTKLHLAVLLTTAVLSAPPAQAQLRADTSIGNVQWNVIDLTPDDGQAAGYTPIAATHYRQVRTALYSVAPPYDATDLQSTEDDTQALDSTLAFGTARAWGHADPGFTNAQVSAIGDATLGGGGYATTNFSGGYDFTLLPHTRLEISARATWADVHLNGGVGTAAWAASYLIAGELSGQEPPFPIHFELSRRTGPGWMDTSGYEDFTLVYLNDTDVPLTTSFYVSINANVSAVPEPSQLVLLLGGLGGLAAWLRGRPRQPR